MKKTDPTGVSHDEIKGWEGSVDFPMSEEKQATSHNRHSMENPALTFAMAACLVAAPILGLVATNVITHGSIFSAQAQAATFELEVKGGAGEDDDDDENENMLAEVTPLRPQEVSEQDLDLFNIKRLGYEISEGGIIESAENIIVEPEGHTLRFVDSTKDGKIAFKADEGYELESALLEGSPVAIEGNLINIPAGARGTLRITFVITAPPVETPQEEPAPAAEEVATDNGGGGNGGYAAFPEPEYTYDYQQEPAYEEPQPEPAPEPQYEAPQEPQAYYEEVPWPSAPAPVEGNAGMSGDELSMAQEIFNCYNDWRAAQGLPRTNWDGYCCDMAMGSSKGCSERRKLVHRLGIPGELQTSYSDILQYASWRMSGDEAVQRWANSSGHAAQMRCPTAQNAACAVYQENGIYWFAIVYTFQGTNIG